MPVVKIITDPRKIAEQLLIWLDEPEDTPDPDDSYDGFDIDPYDDERERGH